MGKVLTFSRAFPSYHPRKGEPTYFVEKITQSRILLGNIPCDIPDEIFSTEMYHICEPKYHTIRAGNRWKVGDQFSPRVWSGKPYNSKQIIIVPDIEVKKVWDIVVEKDCFQLESGVKVVTKIIIDGKHITSNYEPLSMNDGLSLDDLCNWFNKPFKGQIICWNENINY
jgi:hypothetical protein